jgi:hypothetical protein
MRSVALALATLGLMGTGALAQEAAPNQIPCPKGPPADAKCLAGVDSAKSPYLIVMPANWSGILVVHAHGGPELGPPSMRRAEADIERWSIFVRAGHAYAASVFRQGGVAVSAAAEDTDRVRRIFLEHVDTPRRTILHGQSWGANVAAKAAELFVEPINGRRPWDAVMLTSGVVAGGRKNYDFRLDLRVIYQHVCANHPKADEPQYPLWMGLPPNAPLTRQELARRVEECLGTNANRSPEQAARLKTIVDVVKVDPASIGAHLNWATWHFQDIIQRRTGGGNPFTNIGARYTGSTNDDALNAAVPRYAADPAATALFEADAGLTGKIPVPVISLHAINDPTVFVEAQSVLRETMTTAGTAERLVQLFGDFNTHSYLSDPIYPTLVDALLHWVDRGQKPTPQSLAAACTMMEAKFPEPCKLLPDYTPKPIATRVAAR